MLTIKAACVNEEEGKKEASQERKTIFSGQS